MKKRDELEKDSARLQWLIDNGYGPAQWREPKHGERCLSANGLIRVGPCTKETIDAAMARRLKG